ncbi:MAG TPA: hypothetical protein PLW65_10285 [Pseudomonadota bacterium]|nr:hypothetical protein [Pseudomonadota bacterium]
MALWAYHPASARGDAAPARPVAALAYLPIGSRCHGFLPCEASGDFGIHLRVLGALSLDEQRRVRSGLLAPSLLLSALQSGECGVAFPLRFPELGGPLPERLRVFCQLSLPKSLLPTSGASVFASLNLSVGPFDEAAAPAGRRSTTAEVGGVLGGQLGPLVHAGVSGWATVGEALPTLHAGAELSVRTDFVTLFAQVQLEDRLGCSPNDPPCAWGLLGTFGLSFPEGAFPLSTHASFGRGAAAPSMLLAVQGGVTYDVKVHARHGDGHEVLERFWDRAFGPLRYRLQLRRRGYYDPYPDEQGLLRDDLDHSVLGLIGTPDPTRPGYILTPFGVSIPVGASLEIRGDRPFVASPAFPGRVLTYIPLLSLTQNGGALARPIFDESYFALLEAERQREELAVQDDLRRMDSPWAKAALNAAVRPLLESLLLFLAAASPDTPDLPTLLRQAQLIPYRDGYEEYKGEIAETLLVTYGSLLAGGLGPLRSAAAITARELAAGLEGLGVRATLGSATRAPRLLTHLAPRLNPGNYQLKVRGLGSNFGNLKLGYTGAEAGRAAEVIEVAEHARPALSGSTEGAELLSSDRTLPSRPPDPNAVPRGSAEFQKGADAEQTRALQLQDEAAHSLARNGYDVLRKPPGKANGRNPDYQIEGRYFDCYSPNNSKPRNIWTGVRTKVKDEQVDRVVINLDNSSVDISALRKQFETWPIENLREVIFLKNGNILPP